MMDFYQTLGWFLIAFTSLIGFAVLIYLVYRGATQARHELTRGKFENDLDIKKAIETRYVERMLAQ